MNQRSLHVFVTLAETLHFRKTSELCHMTTSALSRMIKRLEEEVGMLLLERTNRDVKLTETGKHFLLFAKHMLSEWEQFQSAIAPRSPASLTGSVKLYGTVTAAYSVLPSWIKAFRQRYPGVMTYLQTGVSWQGFRLLAEGAVDFAIGSMTHKSARQFAYHKILETPLVYVVPLGQEQAPVLSLPLILPESGDLGDMIAEWLKTQKAIPKVHSYIEGNEAMLAMVAAGLGSTILPSLVVENSHLKSQVSIIAPEVPLPVQSVGLFMKETAYMPAGKAAFWEFLKQASPCTAQQE